ncbi:UPAR/Ly6 domain-containing protein qvr [Caenorhabditis elegans]|uniref:UPAR/Ly6 domain-containing protein qvr n=1 Tax=Caenorhabditis elegans TaxID=6239 RepID=Q565B0_CAEEL|nr:Protein quiver [Caenorhabditis elegans]CAI79224.1 Protein quiver [Caenorhabditis elegans]|eukprot:NP_001024623.1 Protein quiver [Caenorhabditis elegans]
MSSAIFMASVFSLITVVKSQDIRCYACTTIDANAMLSEISDPNWLRWLENVRYVPFSQKCIDYFEVDQALRDGVRSNECSNGVCMKMIFQEKSGINHVWRSCIPNAKEQIRSDCTKITSGEGNLEVCTCDGNLCNNDVNLNLILIIMFSAAVLLL